VKRCDTVVCKNDATLRVFADDIYDVCRDCARDITIAQGSMTVLPLPGQNGRPMVADWTR
jgi:hypothetical protein